MYIQTIEFGLTPIRKTYTEGKPCKSFLMSDGTCYEIRTDFATNQPFAVQVDYYTDTDDYKI